MKADLNSQCLLSLKKDTALTLGMALLSQFRDDFDTGWSLKNLKKIVPGERDPLNLREGRVASLIF